VVGWLGATLEPRTRAAWGDRPTPFQGPVHHLPQMPRYAQQRRMIPAAYRAAAAPLHMTRALALAALFVICLGASGCISVWANLFDRDDRALGTYQRP
jgi:hypothetical protein